MGTGRAGELLGDLGLWDAGCDAQPMEEPSEE